MEAKCDDSVAVSTNIGHIRRCYPKGIRRPRTKIESKKYVSFSGNRVFDLCREFVIINDCQRTPANQETPRVDQSRLVFR